MLSRDDIFKRISSERDRQEHKWGHVKKDIPGYLLVIESELNEAKEGWVKQREGKHSVINELVQVAATAVACLEQHGFEL